MGGICYLGSVLADEFEEFVDGLGLGDILFYTLFGAIERDLTTSRTDIAIVGISHLTGTVDDTTHDTDLQAYKILRSGFDLGDGFLEVVERAPTTWAGDVFGLGELHSCGLQNTVG